jgi:SAM-dependent methyltransferase
VSTPFIVKPESAAHVMPSPVAQPATHYGSEYFHWQSEIGRFGGWANLSKFAPFVEHNMRVLDFGCGGGFLLYNLNCREKLGIEINPVARAAAEHNSINAVSSAAEVPDGWADLIISNHALEHCTYPLGELQELFRKVAPGGRIVFFVPSESIRHKFKKNDPNHHLYSWSPMSAANLFSEAGFRVQESKAYLHVWPPSGLPKLLRRIGGRFLFELGCRAYGTLTYLGLSPTSVSQIRIVAQRPAQI